ncbi:MAG: hypothetical protein LBG83_04595 [Oscillospiraceae bacterium]|nr:hypothetical protein [Oscillospiraceae bacterium]
MKRTIAIALALVLALSLAACGSKDNPTDNPNSSTSGTSQGGNKSGAQQLITENRTTGDGSMAREQYYAETVREEFTFDKNGVLTGYQTIYTFENGVNDKQKQEALDTLLGGNFAASAAGNTIVVDGNGNYLGFPYAESNLAEIKERLEEKGTKYNLGSIGEVSVPAGGGGSAIDINTVEGRLAKAGLKLADIQPANFAEASLYNCDKDAIVMYLTNGSGKLGAAIIKPLVEKVLAATAAAADDGKNHAVYYGLGDPKDLDWSGANYDAWSFLGQWSYQTGGKWVTATLGVVPAEEPDGQDNYAWEVTLAFNY